MTALRDALRRLLQGPSEPIVQDAERPLYARVLRLRSLEPGPLLCALFFEGSVLVALLLAFADLVSWWGVLALPVTVAAMVKLNDLVASHLPAPAPSRQAQPRRSPSRRTEAAGTRAGASGPAVVAEPQQDEPDLDPAGTVTGLVRVTPAFDETATLELPVTEGPPPTPPRPEHQN